MPVSLFLTAKLLVFLAAAKSPVAPQNVAAAAEELKLVTIAVVDIDSGKPISAFGYQVWYEAPGVRSAPAGNEWKSIESPDGTFTIDAPFACRLSVRIESADYIRDSPGTTSFVIKSTDNPRQATIRLRRGITVKGTVRDATTGEVIAGQQWRQ